MNTYIEGVSIQLYINSICIHVSQLHCIIGHIENAWSCATELFDIVKRYNVTFPDIMSNRAFLSFICHDKEEPFFPHKTAEVA